MIDKRISAYREAALEMAKGHFNLDIPVGPESDGEVAQLGRALLHLCQTLEGKFSEISTLNTVTMQANAGIVIEEVLNCIYESFRPIIPFDRIGFALLEQKGRILRSRWCRSESGELRLRRGYAAPMEGSSLNTIIQTGQPRILNDLDQYLKEHPNSDSTRRIHAEGVRSSLTCPLIAMGRPIGFLFFSSFTPHTYADVHIDLFLQIAGQLAVILEKSRLYERLEETNQRLRAEIEERKRVEQALRESEEKLRAANQQLQRLAELDGLTGVANRRAFAEKLAHEWRRASRSGGELSIVLLDVDYFKAFNDTRGHLAGDQCLKLVASLLRDVVHRAGDLVARYGGEEFAILLPDTDGKGALSLAERIRSVVAGKAIAHPGSTVAPYVTVSVGVACGRPRAGQPCESLVEAADRALYRAKANGRNRVEFSVKYEPQSKRSGAMRQPPSASQP